MTQQKVIWKFKLYIVDDKPASRTASDNLHRVCDERLKGNCEIEVIDIAKHPQIASDEQILAVPTLVKQFPEPVRKFIGDLSSTERLIVGLGIKSSTLA